MSNNKLELKIMALKEGFRNRVASILDEYEEKIADLRIELTELDERLRETLAENENLKALLAERENVQEEDTAPADSDDSN